MTWLHMEFVLIFITGPSQIGQNGLAAAADARLADSLNTPLPLPALH